MKKLIIVLIFSLITVSGFATTPKHVSSEIPLPFWSIVLATGNELKSRHVDEVYVVENVKTSFAKRFKKAENVNWSKTNEFYFVDFQLHDQKLSAAYDESGELLGMSRPISFSQISLAAQESLLDRFEDYSFGERIIELMFNGSTTYIMGAENNAKILKLTCTPDGSINVEKAIKKKKLFGTAY